MRASSPSDIAMARAEVADRPLVSVGLPVYNGDQFLGGAIDSLLGQSYANLELIISDNASTDSTGAIARRYAARDPRVRYFRQLSNTGAARNWNFVATHARGKYMKWASANDYCDSAMFAACVTRLDSDPQAVLCYGTTRLVDEASGVVQPYDGDFAILDERPSARLARLWAELKLNNAISGLIRMQALRRTGLIRSYAGGDLVLMAELAMAGRFILLPDPYLHRRIGGRTLSSHLSESELRLFLNPRAKFGASLDQVRINIDYFASVLRASMPLRETRRALTLATRRAYWDVRRMIGRPHGASGVRH